MNITLGITFKMPEGEKKSYCDDCGNLHEPVEECSGRLYDEKEIVDEETIKILDPVTQSLDKVKEMLGRKDDGKKA